MMDGWLKIMILLLKTMILIAEISIITESQAQLKTEVLIRIRNQACQLRKL